jgi:hypothetical protein
MRNDTLLEKKRQRLDSDGTGKIECKRHVLEKRSQRKENPMKSLSVTCGAVAILLASHSHAFALETTDLSRTLGSDTPAVDQADLAEPLRAEATCGARALFVDSISTAQGELIVESVPLPGGAYHFSVTLRMRGVEEKADCDSFSPAGIPALMSVLRQTPTALHAKAFKFAAERRGNVSSAIEIGWRALETRLLSIGVDDPADARAPMAFSPSYCPSGGDIYTCAVCAWIWGQTDGQCWYCCTY